MLEALGQYKILGHVGRGGLGELFRARDTRAGRTVALRVIAPDIAGNPERRRQFVEHVRGIAAISHPNIATVYEVGEDREHLFIVSEFVPGDTLRTLIAGRALNPRHALDHGIQLADALAEAHAAGVLHHDVQPGNIIITPKGIAKFIDFGLGAWTESGAERKRIAGRAGDDAGSSPAVAYMAPEHVLGGSIDHRADIFSLGAVLFEMLVGTPPPFAAPGPNARTEDVLNVPPPPPSAVNRGLPPEVDAITGRMLARRPDARYQAAATAAAELRSLVALLDARETSAAAVPMAPRSSGRPPRTAWILLLVIVGVVIAALVFFFR
jgi:serine/threonine protein kinase